jgi:hypothetical protein
MTDYVVLLAATLIAGATFGSTGVAAAKTPRHRHHYRSYDSYICVHANQDLQRATALGGDVWGAQRYLREVNCSEFR